MAGSTNINVRVDAELKQQAEELFDDLGLSLSSAITLFLKSAVSHEGIPFEIRRSKAGAPGAPPVETPEAAQGPPRR